jgi:dUTP pyrophosphatase
MNNLTLECVDEQGSNFTRGSEFSAGNDLCANKEIVVKFGEIAKVPTGIKVSIPEGYYGKIEARSGLAIKQGISIMAGVIDSDYRGEIFVGMTRVIPGEYKISKGDKMAQIIIHKYYCVTKHIVTSLDDTERGDGGFGSTGK